MRARLFYAPRWVLFLYFAVTFGTVMGVLAGFRTDSVVVGVVGGLVMGLLFGAAMTPFVVTQRDGLLARGLTPERTRAAGRRALWGAVPADPAVRADAAALVEHSLQQMVRVQKWGVGLFGVLLASQVFLAVRGTLQSPWPTTVFLLALFLYLGGPVLYRRRLARLRSGD